MANMISEIASPQAYRRIRDVSQAKDPLAKAQGSEKEKPPVAEKQPVNRQEAMSLEEAVNRLEDAPQLVKRNLEFSIDKDTGRQVVRVVDSETGELVRQIPPEEILNLISRMQQMNEDLGTGVLFNGKV